jgi:hypothetical protein
MRITKLAAALAVVVTAPVAATERFDEPPTEPAAPTAADAISARLIVPIACEEPQFVVVRIDTVVELRYQPPSIDCPTLPTDQPRTVAIGALPAGTYDLRVLNVLAAGPGFDDQATVVVTPSGCEPDPALPAAGQSDLVLCIGGRFTVTAEWTAHDGSHGFGRPLPLTAESGAFWFFHEDNLELMVKVLDACSYNQRSWVFAAGLTDVGVVLRVFDKVTRVERTYTSVRGHAFQPVTDTTAFGCPAP